MSAFKYIYYYITYTFYGNCNRLQYCGEHLRIRKCRYDLLYRIQRKKKIIKYFFLSYSDIFCLENYIISLFKNISSVFKLFGFSSRRHLR